MRALVLAAITFAIAATSCGKTLRPGYCRTQADCNGGTCDIDGGTWKCLYDAGTSNDASTDRADATDAVTDASEVGDGADRPDVPKPFFCESNAHCVDAGMLGVCVPDAGTCVECLPTNNPCTGTKPICSGTICVPCRNDSNCAGPGICMTDGHCAGDSEVVYVDYTATACPGNGNSATPFCRLTSVFPTANQRVVIIRGPVDDKMQLNTTGVRPVIIGRKNAANADASIPAGAGNAIVVGSDDVLIRDLVVAGSIAATAKGVVVSGSSTKLTLVNVRVALGMGLGIQADTGAELTMDRCYVENNAAGGLLINGASYSIENSVFAANGFSQVQFSAAANPGTPRFRFNTIVATTGNAATCDPSNMRTLSDSIIVGGANCSVVNSVQTMPNFKTMPPYHLMAHVECPAAPSMPPAHDIDGDPRVAPIDCGADQFVP